MTFQKLGVVSLAAILGFIFSYDAAAYSFSRVNRVTWGGLSEPTIEQLHSSGFSSKATYTDAAGDVDVASSYIDYRPIAGRPDDSVLNAGYLLRDTDGGEAETETTMGDIWTCAPGECSALWPNGLRTRYHIQGSWLESEWDYSELSFNHQVGRAMFEFGIDADGDTPSPYAYRYEGFSWYYYDLSSYLAYDPATNVTSIDAWLEGIRCAADILACPLAIHPAHDGAVLGEKVSVVGDMQALGGGTMAWADFSHTFTVEYIYDGQGTLTSDLGRTLLGAQSGRGAAVQEPPSLLLLGLGLLGMATARQIQRRPHA